MTTLFILILGIFLMIFILKIDEGEEDYREPQGDKDFVDVTGLTQDQIEEWQGDDAKDFYGNLARQARAEVNLEQHYRNFGKEHWDFENLWDSGALEKLMMDREIPEVTDAISAYYHYQTQDSRAKDHKTLSELSSVLTKRAAERRGQRSARKRESLFDTVPTMEEDL